MDNKSLTHKLTQSHQKYMQKHKKNLLKRRRQQLTTNKIRNEDNQSFSHLNSPNISKSLKEFIISKFDLSTNESLLDESLMMLNSDNLMTTHQGIMNLRQILIKDDFNLRQKVLDSPSLDKIIQFCQQDQQKHLKLEAAWCIANLSVGVSSQINFLVKKNIIKVLENVIQDPFSQIAEQGVWAIGNISSDEVKYRNLILQSKIVDILKLKLENTDNEMVQKIIWVFSNICQNTSQNDELNEQIFSLLDILKKAFVALNNKEIKKDCIAGFQIWIKEEECRKLILQDDFLEQFKIYYTELVQNLKENNLKIANCNNLVGSLTAKDDEESFKILEFRFLTEIKKVLLQGNIHLINQSLWIIGNIALSSENHLQMIFSENELTEIIIHFTQHQNQNIAYEALWVVQNFTKANSLKHLNYILSNGLLDTLKKFLTLQTDEKLCLLALSSIKNLLEFFYMEQGEENSFLQTIEDNGIMDQLEELQQHQSLQVYNLIVEILEQYFESEDQLIQYKLMFSYLFLINFNSSCNYYILAALFIALFFKLLFCSITFYEYSSFYQYLFSISINSNSKPFGSIVKKFNFLKLNSSSQIFSLSFNIIVNSFRVFFNSLTSSLYIFFSYNNFSFLKFQFYIILFKSKVKETFQIIVDLSNQENYYSLKFSTSYQISEGISQPLLSMISTSLLFFINQLYQGFQSPYIYNRESKRPSF